MLISHEDQLVLDIASLQDNPHYNDVTIMLNNGVKLEANKFVLRVRSKFFERLFQGGSPVQTEIKLDISALKGSLYLIVKYLYTGKMDLSFMSFDDLLDLIKLTKYLEMDLFNLIEGHMADEIDQFDTRFLLQFAKVLESYELTKLSDSLILLLRIDIENVSKYLEVQHLPSSFLEKLLVKRLKKNEDVLSDNEDGLNDSNEMRSERKTGLNDCNDDTRSENDTASDDEPGKNDEDELDDESEMHNETGSDIGSNEEEETVDLNDNKLDDSMEICDNSFENQVNEFNVFINWLRGNADCDVSFKKRIAKLFDLRKFPVDYLIGQVRSSSLYTEEDISDIICEKVTQMKSKIEGLKRNRFEMEKEIRSLKESYKSLEADHKRLLDDDVTKSKKRKIQGRCVFDL